MLALYGSTMHKSACIMGHPYYFASVQLLDQCMVPYKIYRLMNYICHPLYFHEFVLTLYIRFTIFNVPS